jgi:hypothetical protein
LPCCFVGIVEASAREVLGPVDVGNALHGQRRRRRRVLLVTAQHFKVSAQSANGRLKLHCQSFDFGQPFLYERHAPPGLSEDAIRFA